jgi:hypothetical protein
MHNQRHNLNAGTPPGHPMHAKAVSLAILARVSGARAVHRLRQPRGQVVG